MTTLPASQAAGASKPVRDVKPIAGRMRKNTIFQGVCIAATLLAILILIVLLLSIITQGIGVISLDFITSLNSSDPHKAGIWTSLIGTIMICAICGLSAIPLGVGTAVLIEEFKPKSKTLLWFHGIIDTNIRNLAGVPSIVYGILGVSVFATMFGVFGPMNSGNLAIGIEWYDQYQAEDKRVYYTPRKGSLDNDPTIVPATEGMTLYVSSELEEEATEITWVKPEDIDDRVEAIEADMDEFEGAFRDELDELRTSRRGPISVDAEQADAAVVAAINAGSWELPAMDAYEQVLTEQLAALKPAAGESYEVTTETAETLADRAIAAGDWSNEDTSSLRAYLVALFEQLDGEEAVDLQAVMARAKNAATLSEKTELRAQLNELVLGLDGKSGVDLILARKEAIAVAVDSEYANRMPQTMIIGKEPVRVNRKAWYHFSLPFGRGVLAGGLTLMLVILPIVIVASQEALRAVPGSYRQGALAMGATRWQAVSKTALPAAIPGICTGVILAISRAIGEAAPILVLGGTGFITSPPQNLMDKFSAMPMTIFQWTKEPEAYFKDIAAGGIIILMIVLLSFNAIAIYIRHRSSKHH